MLKKVIIGLVACIALAACGSNKTTGKLDDGKHFGMLIDAKKAMKYDELVPKMANVDSMPAKVTAKVSQVCQKKGCWMTLVSEKGHPPMRVTFKDYAFFMPKDLSGKEVVVQGFAFVETTSVDVLRHYAEDAGKTKEEIAAITQPKRELSFEAAGVVILDK
jgi:Domain of unknown function (DUF4920)